MATQCTHAMLAGFSDELKNDFETVTWLDSSLVIAFIIGHILNPKLRNEQTTNVVLCNEMIIYGIK